VLQSRILDYLTQLLDRVIPDCRYFIFLYSREGKKKEKERDNDRMI